MDTHHRVAHALCEGRPDRDFSEFASTAERIGGDYDRQLRGTVLLLIGLPVAERIAEEVFRYRFGLKRPDQREWNHDKTNREVRSNNTLIDQWEHFQAVATREVENLIYPPADSKAEPMLLEGALYDFGKKRTIEAVTYADADVFSKKRHDCEEKDRFATRHDFNGDSRTDESDNEGIENSRLFSSDSRDVWERRDINPYDLCENEWEHSTLSMLLEGKLTVKEIARCQRCSTKTVSNLPKKLMNRTNDTGKRREPKTSDPKVLRKLAPLPHDNCRQDSGCPVTRFTSYFQLQLDARDRLLLELYRDGLDIDEIKLQTNWNEGWIKQRLGELAFDYLTM